MVKIRGSVGSVVIDVFIVSVGLDPGYCGFAWLRKRIARLQQRPFCKPHKKIRMNTSRPAGEMNSAAGAASGGTSSSSSRSGHRFTGLSSVNECSK